MRSFVRACVCARVCMCVRKLLKLTKCSTNFKQFRQQRQTGRQTDRQTERERERERERVREGDGKRVSEIKAHAKPVRSKSVPSFSWVWL